MIQLLTPPHLFCACACTHRNCIAISSWTHAQSSWCQVCHRQWSSAQLWGIANAGCILPEDRGGGWWQAQTKHFLQTPDAFCQKIREEVGWPAHNFIDLWHWISSCDNVAVIIILIPLKVRPTSGRSQHVELVQGSIDFKQKFAGLPTLTGHVQTHQMFVDGAEACHVWQLFRRSSVQVQCNSYTPPALRLNHFG